MAAAACVCVCVVCCACVLCVCVVGEGEGGGSEAGGWVGGGVAVNVGRSRARTKCCVWVKVLIGGNAWGWNAKHQHYPSRPIPATDVPNQRTRVCYHPRMRRGGGGTLAGERCPRPWVEW